ncbi:MAG: Laccase domain protein YfiH [Betaproteobacteria bacterium ADurb.Bin341]|nr:MAG: Laccase domain protein YfiH [Betaproteobacteria bacterium ADurb.Bin341]
MAPECIIPDWPAPPNVGALQTTRRGGVSQGPYASLNLGDHVGDHPEHVTANRRLLQGRMMASPCSMPKWHSATPKPMRRWRTPLAVFVS